MNSPVSSLTNLTFPWSSFAASSNSGAIKRQGPHLDQMGRDEWLRMKFSRLMRIETGADTTHSPDSYQVANASTTRGWSHSCNTISNSSPFTDRAHFVSLIIFSADARVNVRGMRLDRHIENSVEAGWDTNAEAADAVARIATRRSERIFARIITLTTKV